MCGVVLSVSEIGLFTLVFGSGRRVGGGFMYLTDFFRKVDQQVLREVSMFQLP